MDREILAYTINAIDELVFDFSPADMFRLLLEWTKRYNLRMDHLSLFSRDSVDALLYSTNGIFTESILVRMLQANLEAEVKCHQLTLSKKDIVLLENTINWKIEHFEHFL